MIIYNITINVLWNVHDEWMKWLTGEHLSAILATGVFTHYRIVKLLEVKEDDGPTYAIQLYANEIEDVSRFRKQHLQNFEMKEQERWGNNIYTFSTVMEVIN